jgi:hypothetical protein
VTVTGTVNPNGKSTSYYFQYGVGTSLSSKTSAQAAGSGTTDLHVTATLSGLMPATEYQYRIVATNDSGTIYGGIGIFSTTALPYVVTGAAIRVAASTATLKGLVNSEGLTTTWDFQYGTTTNYGLTSPMNTLPAGPNDANASATVSNLAPNTTYDYRLVATSSAGTVQGVNEQFVTGRTVSINASSPTLVYGQSVLLSGKVASGLAGVKVTVVAKPNGQTSFSGVATILTGTGGRWSYSRPLAINTTFEALANGGSSSPFVVGVRPAVFLNMIRNHRLVARVVAAESYASQVVLLQRLSQNNWVAWKPVRLGSTAKAAFATRLPVGTMIRVATLGTSTIGVGQAVPGYLEGFSRTIPYIHR